MDGRRARPMALGKTRRGMPGVSSVARTAALSRRTADKCGSADAVQTRVAPHSTTVQVSRKPPVVSLPATHVSARARMGPLIIVASHSPHTGGRGHLAIALVSLNRDLLRSERKPFKTRAIARPHNAPAEPVDGRPGERLGISRIGKDLAAKLRARRDRCMPVPQNAAGISPPS